MKKQAKEKPAIQPSCQWFVLCDNAATTTRSHPILGEVPICQHCADKMNRIGGK